MYKELDDIYSKYINPQVRVQYDDTDCLCNMSGKQTLEGGSHAFVFNNGSISVTVDEQDNVTVAEADSGSGGGDVMMVSFTGTEAAPITDKTYAEVAEAIQNGQLVVFVDNISSPSEGAGIANKVVLGQDVAFQTTIPIIAHNSLSYLQLGIDPIGVAFYSRPLN